MAIVVERYEDSVDLIRTFSDRGMKIRQDETGILYDEAVDPDYMGRTYTETDIPIDYEEPEKETDDEGYLEPQSALEMIFGEMQ